MMTDLVITGPRKTMRGTRCVRSSTGRLGPGVTMRREHGVTCVTTRYSYEFMFSDKNASNPKLAVTSVVSG